MGIYATIMSLGGHGDEQGAPYKYLGSHILPETGPDAERAGAVSLSLVPDHVAAMRQAAAAGQAPARETYPTSSDGNSGRGDILRLTVDDGNSTATVVIDRGHAQALHQALSAWLSDEAHP